MLYISKKKSWNKARLAKEIGVSRSAYGQYLAGTTEPSVETLLKMGKATGVPLDDLLYRDLEKEGVKLTHESMPVGSIDIDELAERVADKIESRKKVKKNSPPADVTPQLRKLETD